MFTDGNPETAVAVFTVTRLDGDVGTIYVEEGHLGGWMNQLQAAIAVGLAKSVNVECLSDLRDLQVICEQFNKIAGDQDKLIAHNKYLEENNMTNEEYMYNVVLEELENLVPEVPKTLH